MAVEILFASTVAMFTVVRCHRHRRRRQGKTPPDQRLLLTPRPRSIRRKRGEDFSETYTHTHNIYDIQDLAERKKRRLQPPHVGRYNRKAENRARNCGCLKVPPIRLLYRRNRAFHLLCEYNGGNSKKVSIDSSSEHNFHEFLKRDRPIETSLQQQRQVTTLLNPLFH